MRKRKSCLRIMQQQFNEKRIAIEKEMQDKVDAAVQSVASKRGFLL